MQYHWVVCYDQETHKFEIDWDSTQILLAEDSGVAFDPDTQQWHNLDEVTEIMYEDYSTYLGNALDNIDTM